MNHRSDYRSWMKASLKERMETNPRYSLRAFARDLKLSPALISLVLNGRKGLSKTSAEVVAKQLGLTQAEQEYFKTLVLSQHSRSKSGKQMAKIKLESIGPDKSKHSLDLDHFQIISSWYHFGLLQLTHLKSFQSNVAWISKQLDIPESDVRDAVARLKRLGLLRQNGTKLTATKDVIFAKEGIPSDAIRKFHRQMIEKALRANQEQNFDQRVLLSSQIPIKLSEIPKISAKMKALNEEIIQKHTTSAQDGEAVYGVTFHLFQLNKDLPS